MKNLEKSFRNLLDLEIKAKDIYDKMMENGLDEESLKNIKRIELEEVGHIKKAEALILLNKMADKRKNKAVRKKTADFFKKDFLFKQSLLETISGLVDSRIETMELLEMFGKNNEKFIKSGRARQDLVNKIIHDLKTPLTLTKWLTDTLLKEEEGLSQNQEKMIKEIEDSNQSIISFVEDLISTEKAESPGMNIEKKEFDLVRLAEDIIKELNPLLSSRGQKVIFTAFNSSIVIKNSEDFLSTIISNLLTNASQYGLKKNISLEIKKDKEGILMAISDKGIGIPENQKAHIFEKFFRTTNARAAYEKGTGLGLYIVKTLADKIGSKIWFESKENRGTTFYVRLKRF
jgi:signal transduction histidine kinase